MDEYVFHFVLMHFGKAWVFFFFDFPPTYGRIVEQTDFFSLV